MEANDYAALRTEAPSVFFGIARMSGTWFDNDDGNLSAGDETIKASRRERLQYIARQMMQSCPEESLQPKLCKNGALGANGRKLQEIIHRIGLAIPLFGFGVWCLCHVRLQLASIRKAHWCWYQQDGCMWMVLLVPKELRILLMWVLQRLCAHGSAGGKCNGRGKAISAQAT